ncbi:MAG: flavodoxin family protein [Candidatus Gastranaerophilales bacterium]|nr:flavodoxin family protein [Candidatus Gastranaerophilales bacterium]
MKKVVILNGSPRKNFNTAKLLKEAQKGCEAAGAEVEYFNLYDLNYKGCLSCFACKRKGNNTNCVCAIKDDLRPVLEKCIQADSVIIGSPVYFSMPTGEFRSFLERLLFPVHTYLVDKKTGGLKSLRPRVIPVGIIYTMNCPKEMVEKYDYPRILDVSVDNCKVVFGYSEALYAYNTYQFIDYSKYDIDLFDEKEKAKYRDEHFPKDLEKAFEFGKKLVNFK